MALTAGSVLRFPHVHVGHSQQPWRSINLRVAATAPSATLDVRVNATDGHLLAVCPLAAPDGGRFRNLECALEVGAAAAAAAGGEELELVMIARAGGERGHVLDLVPATRRSVYGARGAAAVIARAVLRVVRRRWRGRRVGRTGAAGG